MILVIFHNSQVKKNLKYHIYIHKQIYLFRKYLISILFLLFFFFLVYDAAKL